MTKYIHYILGDFIILSLFSFYAFLASSEIAEEQRK